MNLDLIQNKITNLRRIIDLQIIVFFEALKKIIYVLTSNLGVRFHTF